MRARLFENADVLTVDERFSRHSALLVDAGGRITALGAAAELSARAPDAERVDLGGKSVVPGFVDAHHHFLLASVYGSAVDCHPDRVRSIEDIQSALRERHGLTAPDAHAGPVWIAGYGYDDHLLAERRAPTRDELDAACPDRPVLLLHYSFHQGVASSRALELLGIDENTPDPPGGVIERDRRGRLTGRLFELPFSRAETVARASIIAQAGGALHESIRRYEARLFAFGITRVCDPTVPPSLRPIYQEARRRGALGLPVVMMPVSEQGYLVQPWELVEEAPAGDGGDGLFAGPIKLFFDGGERCAVCMTPAQALGSGLRAAALALRERSFEPLAMLRKSPPRRGADGKLHAGISFYSSPEANEIVARAVERGYSVAIHAFGNEAVGQALEAIGRVRKRHGEVPPPRIEHAAILSDDLMDRAADLGVQVVTQPAFLGLMGAAHAVELSGLSLLPLRSLLDRGVSVASSSDGPMAFDPLVALRAAVTRRATPRRMLYPEQAIAAEAWLASATREGARAAASLSECGTLEPGKRADFVVLNADPLDPARLDELRVEATVLGGELVYGDL